MKAYLSESVLETLAQSLKGAHPAFDVDAFMAHLLPGYDDLGIKDRAYRGAEALKQTLPEDFSQAVDLLIASLPAPFPDETNISRKGFCYWVYTSFVELYGLDHWESSMKGLAAFTQRFTSEFGIRPFLQQHPQQTFAQIRDWATSESLHLRRLASEGTRPRLPWGAKLPPYLEAAMDIMPILHLLHNDPSLYVRRSVANHLNDLSKTHPEVVVAHLQTWNKRPEAHTQWVTRHALRTLVKSGYPDALALLGYNGDNLDIQTFSITPSQVSIESSAQLALHVCHIGETPQSYVIDFVVHFVKASGKSAPKVFKWATPSLQPGEILHLSKKVPFLQRSTRKLYPGLHRVDLQVNGRKMAEVQIELL